jgi:chromate transporter
MCRKTMSEPRLRPSGLPAVARRTGGATVSLHHIFLVFLGIGTTSVGGGLVAYMRRSLVDKQGWVDDREFVRMLTICQALPGLNGTNMAILTGDHLRGPRGAAAAILGVCLPGGLIMVGAAIAYGAHGHHAYAAAMLTTIAAAAVGIAFSVAIQLGQRSLKGVADLVFVALTVIGVNLLHVSVLVVLAVVGALAIWWYRPRGPAPANRR